MSHPVAQDEQGLTTSSFFRAGYGDFILISSDGVQFHVYRSLLALASGVFRDTFALGPVENSLPVKYPAVVLEALLRWIDPNKPNPVIEASSIADLLEAARFYVIYGLIKWFEDEVMVRRTRLGSKTEAPRFIDEHPLLVLAIAYTLGLSHLTIAAMSELVTCDAESWEESVNVAIDGRLILHCRRLRDQRTQLYSDLVQLLTGHEISNTKKIKDADQETCMSCTVARAEWTHKMMETAIRHPEWSSFQETYNEEIPPHDCDHDISWSDLKRKTFTKWFNGNHPEKMEERLPVLPDWLYRQLRDNDSLAPESMEWNSSR